MFAENKWDFTFYSPFRCPNLVLPLKNFSYQSVVQGITFYCLLDKQTSLDMWKEIAQR